MGQSTAAGAAVKEYVDFLRDKPPLEDVESRLVALAQGYGFEQLAYTVIRKPINREVTGFLKQYEDGALARTTYSAEWIERYDEQDYLLVDPILQRTWSTTTPFRWDHLGKAGKLSKQQKELFGDARSIGMKSGMTIPLHGPEQGLSALNLASGMSERAFDACWSDCRVDLFWAAASTHDVIIANATRLSEESGVRLSSRELECLKWTSEGKTTWEISRILGLSQDTTRSYLREATKKFGVHSKHHAVVRAIAAGLISP